DVAAPGAAQIDQHQRLLPRHPYPLPGMALPPCLLVQPARGQLDAAIDLPVMRHAWPARQPGPCLLRRYQGILEEAAGVAQSRRVGQLAAADIAYQTTDNPTVRLFQPEGLPGSSQGSVIQSGIRSGMQTQTHAQYHVATGLLLEQAVAVGETAVFPVRRAQCSGAPVQGVLAVE